jgi:hypothetical protein
MSTISLDLEKLMEMSSDMRTHQDEGRYGIISVATVLKPPRFAVTLQSSYGVGVKLGVVCKV